MIHDLSLKGMQEALEAIHVKKGDTLLIHSDMRALGMPKEIAHPQEILSFYHKALEHAVGLQGTLSVPAYFYEYARFGTPFDVDHSPVSLSLGSFSRYINSLPGRIRSCNPLQSLAAVGADAEELAGGDSLSGYGVTSPWHRLRLMGGKILFIGMNIQPMTYIHYVEQQYGVPHMYCKIFSTPILRNNIRVPGFPVSAVRYLDFNIVYNLSAFEKVLLAQGHLKVAYIGKGSICCVSAQEVYDAGIHCLDKDPFFFLEHPPQFVPGKIPADGLTGPLNISLSGNSLML